MKYSAVTVAVFPVILTVLQKKTEISSKNGNVESYHKKSTFKDANDEWRILCATIENADPFLVKLNVLLRNG